MVLHFSFGAPPIMYVTNLTIICDFLQSRRVLCILIIDGGKQLLVFLILEMADILDLWVKYGLNYLSHPKMNFWTQNNLENINYTTV